MKFCSLFMGCAIVVAGVVLTKEKLRHYLAFECAIREIAAVSDRHCLATDNPRTSMATIPLPLPSPDLRCSFSLSRARSPPPPLSTSSFTTLACLVRGVVHLHKPANCVLVSFVPYERPFQYPPFPTRARKDAFENSRELAIRANHAFPNYSRLPPSSRHPFLLIIILRSS